MKFQKTLLATMVFTTSASAMAQNQSTNPVINDAVKVCDSVPTNQNGVDANTAKLICQASVINFKATEFVAETLNTTKADKAEFELLKENVADLDLRASALENNQEDLYDALYGVKNDPNDIGIIGTLNAHIEHTNNFQDAVTKVFNGDSNGKTEAEKAGLLAVLDELNLHTYKLTENFNDLVEHVNETNSELEKHIIDTNINLTHAIHTRLSKAKYEADKKKSEEELSKKADKEYVDGIVDRTQSALNGLAEQTTQLSAATERELNGLKGKTTAISEKLDSTEARVTNVESYVKNLSDNTKRVESLETSVANNNARINALNTNVNQLSKELKRGMASQAALAGLFQPYSVGKVNITAAVGGYKSATAVAIGAGYRVNNKFAAKAGVALSSGSPAYNVSVNYEF